MSQIPAPDSPAQPPTTPRPVSHASVCGRNADAWSGPWARWRFADQRQGDDERLLLEAIDARPSLADALVDDQALDAFLHVAAISEKDGPQFVAQVLGALGQPAGSLNREPSDQYLEPEIDPLLEGDGFAGADWEALGGLAAQPLPATPAVIAPPVAAPPVAAPPVAEPPIAAPPVALSPPFPASHLPAGEPTSQWSTRRSRRSLAFPLATLAGAILAIAGLLTLYVVFGGGGSSRKSTDLIAQPDATLPSTIPTSSSLPATVTADAGLRRELLQPVVWRSGGPVDDRLPPGLHELARGYVRLPAHDQLSLELTAPAVIDVDAGGNVELRRGQLRLNGSALPGRHTSVRTPLSVVSDVEGLADLRVAEQGETDIVIREGRLTVADRRSPTATALPIHLSAGEFDRLHLATPREPLSTPLVFTELSGPGGRFLGRIDVNGEPLEFGSPAIFRRMREQSLRQLAQSPQEFIAAWTALAQSLAAQPSGGLNGEASEGNTPSETAADAVFGLSFSSQWNGDGDETFEATIMVDGERRTFRSRVEFEKAQRQLVDRWRQLLMPVTEVAP